VILDEILARKREEVAEAKRARPERSLRAAHGYSEARRGFARAISSGTGRRVIAEIKKASPSKGMIRADFDPATHARDYERAGAACLSVLTDTPFFCGSLDHLRQARAACSLPLLRKDFMIDAYQITEAREAGADAILLIVAALEPTQLADLMHAAVAEGLDVLTEVHDADELAVALRAGATLIGINNRDLRTFHTTTDVTRRLIGTVPAGVTAISESGLADAAELAELEALGVGGFLIGESLMVRESPGDALASLLRS